MLEALVSTSDVGLGVLVFAVGAYGFCTGIRYSLPGGD